MRGLIAGLCCVLGMLQVQASDRWQFGERIAVGAPTADAVFHHLDGAGRKHIAVAGDLVAAAWEDNRSQSPQVYVALMAQQQRGFSAALRASSGSEAYEPSLDAVGDNRFVLGYEQDAAVYVRLLSGDGLGAALRLGEGASHVSVAGAGERAFAAWRERRQGRWFLLVASLRLAGNDELVVESRRPVEADGLATPVLFPVIAVSDGGLSVAWEDRRAGHTRLLTSFASDAGASFSAPQSLNEYLSNRNQYDQGSGVTRVSLAAFGSDELLAAWMDKRRGGAGYGIFAALGSAGAEPFGPNEKVHGAEGDTLPHYNPATAGNPAGDFVVAWDDFRRGDSDVWISGYSDELEWSEDHAPAVASGSGEQSHPSIALDARGNLHLLWLERDSLNGPTRLWYSRGVAR